MLKLTSKNLTSSYSIYSFIAAQKKFELFSALRLTCLFEPVSLLLGFGKVSGFYDYIWEIASSQTYIPRELKKFQDSKPITLPHGRWKEYHRELLDNSSVITNKILSLLTYYNAQGSWLSILIERRGKSYTGLPRQIHMTGCSTSEKIFKHGDFQNRH